MKAGSTSNKSDLFSNEKQSRNLHILFFLFITTSYKLLELSSKSLYHCSSQRQTPQKQNFSRDLFLLWQKMRRKLHIKNVRPKSPFIYVIKGEYIWGWAVVSGSPLTLWGATCISRQPCWLPRYVTGRRHLDITHKVWSDGNETSNNERRQSLTAIPRSPLCLPTGNAAQHSGCYYSGLLGWIFLILFSFF